MRGNDLCHTRCYTGHAPYARGLLSSLTEKIIRWITHKRKSANLLFIQSNEWIFILYITHYTCLWCRYIMTPVVCATLVICPTSVRRCDSSRMPDSDQKTWLRSYLLTPVAHHDSGRWAHRMSYHLSCERLRMAGLDDCNILQPGHLVESRLGGMHDSINIQNLNISRLHMLK
jgi:hypothetical protein